MPLRIGIGVDGVLADLAGALSRLADQPSRGNKPPRRVIDDAAEQAGVAALLDRFPPDLSDAQRLEAWRQAACVPDFWTTLREAEPGAVKRLATLTAEHRWEVLFLGTRGETSGATTQEQTQRWLSAHGFVLPSVYITIGRRAAIASSLSLDLFIDDRAQVCADVAAEAKTRAILVRRQGAPGASVDIRQHGVSVAASTLECFTLAAEFWTSGREGAVRRLMRAFGFRRSAR